MREPGLDIRRHTFTRAFRGFDEAEVQVALDAVAPACEEARATLRQLEQALREASAEKEHLLQGERSVIRLLRSANEHARMCIGSAHRQAERIVEAADEQARARLAKAEEERSALAGEILALERRRDLAFSTLGGLIETLATRPSSASVAAQGVQAPRGPATEPRRSEPDVSAVPSPQTPASRPEPVAHQGYAELPEEIADAERAEGPGTDVEEAPVVVVGRRRLLSMSPRRSAAVAAAIVLSIGAIAWPSARAAREPVVTKRVALPSLPVEVEAEAEAALPDESATAVPEPVPPAPIVVKLTSTRSCWIRVTVDGRTESRMLAAGDEVAWSGEEAIQLRIGDAAAAAVEVNGRPLPPLGREGQVVDRTFTADAQTE
jgi:DivIVA domain-containing protein